MPSRVRIFATPAMLEDYRLMESLRSDPSVDLVEPILFGDPPAPLGYDRPGHFQDTGEPRCDF